MGEKMLRTIWQLPLNAVDGVPETILEIGRQARQARIDLAACDGVAFQLGLGGPDILERLEVGRHFPDHIAVTRPSADDEALANITGCPIQRPRKSSDYGTTMYFSVDLGGCRLLKKNKTTVKETAQN